MGQGDGRNDLVNVGISSAERDLLQASLDMLGSDIREVAALSYERLFTLDPSLRLLFKGDVTAQQQKWISTLTLLVRSLERPSPIMPVVPVVQGLGRRHRSYGVRASDYVLVGEALLWALGQVLGEAFSDEMRRAWQKAYLLLAELMQAAAEEEQTASGL